MQPITLHKIFFGILYCQVIVNVNKDTARFPQTIVGDNSNQVNFSITE